MKIFFYSVVISPILYAIILNHFIWDAFFSVSTVAKLQDVFDSGSTGLKTHSSDHITDFESRIVSFFRSAGKKTFAFINYLKHTLGPSIPQQKPLA